jgi:Cu(I)/Ag(I) efflux system membrane fusion protein
VDLSALQVQAPFASSQAAYVKPKTPVVLTFGRIPNQTFQGEVSSVTTKSSGANQTSYVAIVDFKNDQGLVKPGMTATASVKAGEAKNALAAPNDAIGEDGSGRPVVHVLRGGDWKTLVVKTGLSDGNYTEIKSGLSEGDLVQSPYKD